MKKFSSFMDQDGVIRSREQIVEANSYAEIIQELESNAGWITDTDGAFKVVYIEEIVE